MDLRNEKLNYVQSGRQVVFLKNNKYYETLIYDLEKNKIYLALF